MMTNLEYLKSLDVEFFAVFLRMAGHHVGGWSYMDLVEWLSQEENISKNMTDERKAFYELHG